MSETRPPQDSPIVAAHPSIAAGSARLLLSRVIASGSTFVAFLVLARALVPSERGAVAFVMTAGLVLAGLSSFGLDNATAIFASRWERDRGVLLANLYLFSLSAAALAAGAAAIALTLLPSIRPAGVGAFELLALVVGTVGLRGIGANAAFLLGCSRFRDQAVAYAAGPVVLCGLLGTAWLVHDVGVASSCGLWAMAQVVGAMVGLVAVLRVQQPGRASIALAKRSLEFGIRAWGGSVANLLNARVDQVIMGLISTETALGVYAVAANASEVALYLPGMVALALIPTVARVEPIERVETTLRIFRSLLVLATAVVLLGLACAPLIPVVFGQDYSPSVEPYILLLPGAIPYVALSVLSGSLAASMAPGRSSIGPVTALTVGIALDLMLIPSYGANGAAIAATAAFALGGLAAAIAYIALTGVSARAFVPRGDDFGMIRGLARRTVGLPPE
jgi:O-antigen/teichoic acid export membrane protein